MYYDQSAVLTVDGCHFQENVGRLGGGAIWGLGDGMEQASVCVGE